MAAAPVKSQPLHNFTLPSFLKWGGGKNHRRSPIAAESPEPDRTEPDVDPRPGRNGSRAAAPRNRFSISPCAAAEARRRQAAEIEKETIDGGNSPEKRREGAEKPWNLRPRRGVSSSSTRGAENGAESASPSRSRSIVMALQGEREPKSLRLRETVAGERKEKAKLWIALSREEIEEDVFVMTGSRPARRPKKRPRNVQKQLDNVFPGLWLVGASADDFRVAER